MRKFLLCVVAYLAFGSTVQAQVGRVRQYVAPLAGTVNVGQAEDKYGATLFSLEAPEVDGDGDADKSRAACSTVENRRFGDVGGKEGGGVGGEGDRRDREGGLLLLLINEEE